MADVFISYKRDERSAVEQIAERLRALNLAVWFDASMSAGETFSDEIDREARSAKTILVCWSPAGRDSRWVKAEAMIGFEQDKLAACYVAGPDGFSAPTPFNASHAEDLRAWLAAPGDTHAGWKSVLRRIGKLCGRADIETWGALDAQASAAELRAWIAAHEKSPLFMAVDTLLRSREQQDVERARLEAEARAKRAKEEAERRAREEAERKAQAETERRAREQAERGAREQAERRAEEEVEQQRAAAREQRSSWAFGAGAVALALIAMLIWSPWRTAPAPNTTETATTEPPAQTTTPADQTIPLLPEMVRIPGGSFMMGEGAAQHQVSVAAFAAGKYDVTFDQYDACSDAGVCHRADSPSWGRHGNHPVVNVSWNDAQAYVQWLSQRTGRHYRLLTEAEWEYAARAGTTTAYYWGDDVGSNHANCKSCGSQWDNHSTSPVRSFAPNAFGLYDMAGNVFQWVQDCYDASCHTRVLRGGAWYAHDSGSADRGSTSPDDSLSGFGFRVARTV